MIQKDFSNSVDRPTGDHLPTHTHTHTAGLIRQPDVYDFLSFVRLHWPLSACVLLLKVIFKCQGGEEKSFGFIWPRRHVSTCWSWKLLIFSMNNNSDDTIISTREITHISLSVCLTLSLSYGVVNNDAWCRVWVNRTW